MGDDWSFLAGPSGPAAPTVEQTGAATQVQPDWTWRGVAKEAAAGLTDIGANVINTLSNPAANLIGRPLGVLGGTAYDAIAPMFGANRLTPEQRADLAGNDPQYPQAGNQLMTGIGNLTGASPDDAPAGLVRKAVGAAGTFAAMGPEGIATPAAGALAAVAGDRAASAVPDWAKPGVELATNVAVGGGAAKVSKLADTARNFATGTGSTPVLDAYKLLDIDPVLAGDVTGSPTAQALQAYASKALGGSSRIAPLEQQSVTQFGNAVERTAATLGSSRDAQAAGTALQAEARNWQNTVFPQQQAAAWQPVDQAMATATVDPANYRTALGTLSSKLSALPETQKALLPPRVASMLDAINADVPPGSTMAWPQAQQLRSAIGEIMGVPEISQSVGEKTLSSMYAGLSQDMKASAAANGATALFDNANAVSTAGHAFIDNTLSKIIRSRNPAQETVRPEQATTAVLGGGDTTLQALRAEMPKAADELAAYKLRDMALATPGAAGRTGGETSVGTFLTDLNRMRQTAPNGTKALFSDPAISAKVDALATAASAMKETAKRANTSGTATSLGTMIPMSAVTAAETYHATGSVPLAVASVAAPFVGNAAIARSVSTPALTRFAATPSNAPNFGRMSVGTDLLGAAGYNALAGPDIRRLGGPRVQPVYSSLNKLIAP
jgi:hypothetical protein